MVTGTVLLAMEFCNFCLHLTILPPPNQKKRDGFSQSFSVCHGHSRIHGGLVIARHNVVCDNILHLIQQSFYPNCVHG